MEKLELEIALGRAGEFLAPGDAVQDVFSDHAAPERIVAIQHDAFFGGRRVAEIMQTIFSAAWRKNRRGMG